jgi:hypothetical protein
LSIRDYPENRGYPAKIQRDAPQQNSGMQAMAKIAPTIEKQPPQIFHTCKTAAYFLRID